MGKRFKHITKEHKNFIEAQKIFFVGTAAGEGRVNISPKGMDSLRVLNNNHVAWLNLTGSGNETAAHLQENDRMTLLFCAFEGKPYILRLFGKADIICPTHPEWEKSLGLFPGFRGSRQVIFMEVDLVQKSCGYGVSLFDYVGDRDILTQWTNKKNDDEIELYWKEKNSVSIDGKAIKISGK